jgi:CubicO group peptidase (beta-lactamase class C family)
MGVESQGIRNWLEAVDAAKLELHGFVILRHGETVAEGWWDPYQPQEPHILHSLSKSFTSTAIGFAVSEGLLTVEDPVLSFFPEDAPADPTPFLREMKVKHLLMMGTGHTADFMDGVRTLEDGNWVRHFLANPPQQAPGSLFVYNNLATYMCSAIVTRLTGLTVRDYLVPRLFQPLGIGTPYWSTCPRGNSAGAYGLRLTTRDIAAFGQFLLQKGFWKGKQLLPAAWIDEALSSHIQSAGSDDKPGEPANEWNTGYGYQFWRCQDGSFRADGAFGQICVVGAQPDAVVAFNAGTHDVGAVLGLVWKHLWPAMHQDTLPENPAELAALRTKSVSLAIAPPEGDMSTQAASAIVQRFPQTLCFQMADNPLGLQEMTLGTAQTDVVVLTGRNAMGTFTLRCAVGRWHAGCEEFFIGIAEKPGDPAAGMAALQADGSLRLRVQQLCGPASALLEVTVSGEKLTVKGTMNATFGPPELPVLTGTLVREPANR